MGCGFWGEVPWDDIHCRWAAYLENDLCVIDSRISEQIVIVGHVFLDCIDLIIIALIHLPLVCVSHRVDSCWSTNNRQRGFVYRTWMRMMLKQQLQVLTNFGSRAEHLRALNSFNMEDDTYMTSHFYAFADLGTLGQNWALSSQYSLCFFPCPSSHPCRIAYPWQSIWEPRWIQTNGSFDCLSFI